MSFEIRSLFDAGKNASSTRGAEQAQAQLLLSPFRERPIAVEAPEVGEARLRRIVPRLEEFTLRQLRAQQQRRRWTRVGWLLAALATGAGAGLLYGRFDEREMDGITIAGELVKVGAFDERTVLSGNLQLNALGKVETNSLGAHISTKEGLDIELAPRTSALVGRLGVSAERQQVQLGSGRINCRVPKLGETREFSVVTPDARIVVHGTRFSVEIDPVDSETRTCVRVSEGRVSVHTESAPPVFLESGEQFGCERVEARADGAVLDGDMRVDEMTADVGATEVPPRKALPRRGASASEGTLGEETKLLQAAVRAEQEGRIDESRARLSELLRRYPRSTLAGEARLMLGRLSARQE